MGDTRVPALGMTRTALPCSGRHRPGVETSSQAGTISGLGRDPGRDRRDRPGPVEISREKPGPGPPGNADLDSVARNTLI